MLTIKLWELINEFGKVSRYKINIKKSVAFLCTKTELSESKIKETIPFTITSKGIKYLGINLHTEAKIMYSGILSRGLSHEALKKKKNLLK